MDGHAGGDADRSGRGIVTLATTLASSLYPERRSSLLSAINIAFGVGAAGGPLLSHYGLASGVGWRVQYLGLACMTLLLCVAAALLRAPASVRVNRADRPEATKPKNSPYGPSWKAPEFILLCLLQALYAGTEVGFFTRLPTYFRAQFPTGAAWEGTIVTVFWAAMTAGRFALEPLMRRIALLRLNRLLAAGSALGIFIALAAPTPSFAAAGVAFTGFLLAGVLIIHFTETGNRFPDSAGAIFGGVVASGGIGAAILPWIISALAETSLGWRGALALLILSSLSLIPLSLRLERFPAPQTSRH